MLTLKVLYKIPVIVLLFVMIQTAIAQISGTCQRDEIKDCYYYLQWHLKNTGQNGGTPGEDINIEPVWKKSIRGRGMYIAIVDGDIQLDHEDLRKNVSVSHNKDYYPNTKDTSSHATRVAGIAAARNNNKGVRGVAPRAKIYSLNILADKQSDGASNPLINDILDAMVRNIEITAVSNNSWVSTTPFIPAGTSLMVWERAIETGLIKGFHGKGAVYVWAAGNNHQKNNPRNRKINQADNANYSGYANYHGVVAVCAVNNKGVHDKASEYGANLWVCAPSTTAGGVIKVVTTDIGNKYTNRFGGTSASVPMVSGVVALMRQVNPNLSWRDVKLILANSARKNHPDDDSWLHGATKYGSFGSDADGRYHFSHKYGFGVVDAHKAVELAETWINLPRRTVDTIAEDNATATINASVINRNISIQSDINFIEYIDVPITFAINHFSDLSIKLTSPSGATSMLAEPASKSFPSSFSRQKWRFGSARHLGENPSGTWKLELKHTRGGKVRLDGWQLKIRGYQIKMEATHADDLSDLNIAKTPLTLSLIGAQWKENLTTADIRLKDAPPGLRIASAARTSATQVQLMLDLDDTLDRNYRFQIAATTATVSNLAAPLSSNDINIAHIIALKDVVIPHSRVGADYHFTVEDIFASPTTLNYVVELVNDADEVIENTEIAGLTIDGPIISGTPEAAGDYRLKVTAARDDGYSRTEFFTFSIQTHTTQLQLKVFLEGFMPALRVP